MIDSTLHKYLSKQSLGDVSRLFSTRLLRDLTKPTIGKSFVDLLTALGLPKAVARKYALSTLFECAYAILAENERSEYVFKNAITEKMLFGRHSPRTAALLFEFRCSQSKLDALLLNGTSNAYEIKTSLDELKRLPGQISSYMKMFQNVWLVTDRKHIAAAEKILPETVGIKVLSKRYRLENYRIAVSSLDSVDPVTILSSLRSNEYKRIIKRFGESIEGVPNTRQYAAAVSIFEKMDAEWAHGAMVQELKNRFSVESAELALGIPRSLAAAALSMNLRSSESERLILHLGRKLYDVMETT